MPDAPTRRFPFNEAVRGIATAVLSGFSTTGVSVEPPKIYERCASVFERALRRAPELHEARVRLGRALVEAGKFEEAGRVLEPLFGEAEVPARLKYYARLFHGRALMGLGRGDAAAASYRQADALFPGCQAPQIGLTTALRAAGDEAGARSVMMTFLTGVRPAACPQDPWWDYLLGQAWRIEPLAAALQARVRE
jgi:tetratricopeptide (TPR) repeat protein